MTNSRKRESLIQIMMQKRQTRETERRKMLGKLETPSTHRGVRKEREKKCKTQEEE